jgi:methyl-accepting chemotaxis protein
MMDIACEACGKRYRIDETRMKTDTAKVKCRSCGHVISVIRPPSVDLPESVFDLELPPAAPAPAADDNRMREPAADGGAATLAVTETSAAEPAPEAPYVTPPPASKVRFGLFSKTLVLMLLIGIVPFGVFWFITYQQTGDRLRTDSEALLAQTAKGLADQMDGWVNSNYAVLRTAAKLPEIISMTRERQEPVLRAISREYPWMYLVFTVAASGMNVGRSDNQPLVSYADRQYYKDVMAGKALSWQTVIGRTSKVPALILAVPVKEDNRVIGVIAAAMTVDDLSKQIVNWKKGETGFAFMVDEKGELIAHPDKQLVAKQENLNDHPLIAEFRRKGWTTLTSSFTDANGRPALGHARNNAYGWILALQQDEQEVFGSLALLQNFAMALLAITVLFAATIAWFAARSIVKPILRLTDAAERMSLGDMNVKIDVRSRDEIGLLAQAVARMQTSLRMAMERLRKKR